MPKIDSSAYFRDRSAEYRLLARERGEAGHRESSAMLRELAAEFDAEAAELEGASTV